MRAAVCPGTLTRLRAAVALLCAIAWAAAALGQTPPSTRARAAMALASQTPAPKTAPAPQPAKASCECGECDCGPQGCKDGNCYTCLKCARANAKGRPLALWIGGETCRDHVEVRAQLSEYVHVHLPTFNDSAARRLLVEDKPGAKQLWRFSGNDLNADAVRRTLHPPAPAAAPVPISYAPQAFPQFFGRAAGGSC